MVEYYQKVVNENVIYARQIATAPSLQNFSSQARSVACRNIGIEVDMKNSVGVLTLKILDELQLNNDCPMLRKYVQNHQAWRKAVADYYHISLDEAKKLIISIFFGKAPRSDIPYLWKLKDEVELITDRVLQKDEYKELNKCFNDRPNPKYSRFAHVIAEIEDKMIR